MKICAKCGYRDFNPKVRCHECNCKYGHDYNCDPLVGARREEGCSVVTDTNIPSRCIRKPIPNED